MSSAVHAIVSALFGKVPYTVIIGLVSMIPLLELRGSILAAGLIKNAQKRKSLVKVEKRLLL